MNKETITKILKNQPISQQEASEFIVDYCKSEKEIDITAQQIQGIMQAIQMGMFNLNYAARQAANKENMQIVDIIKDNNIIATIVE